MVETRRRLRIKPATPHGNVERHTRGVQSLKVFLTALAVMDDLGAVAVIALFYTSGLSLACLAGAAAVFGLPLDLNWRHVLGAGLLGGIGLTMSIFIKNLAFAGEAGVINASKMATLLASLAAGAGGFLWLKLLGRPAAGGYDRDTMDFASEQAQT